MYQQFQGQQPQMQQPGGIMTMQQNIQPIVYAPVNQLHMMYGYDKLSVIPGLFIKQKFQLLEVVSGCELQQKFVVYPADQSGEKSDPEILYCKEKSGWCSRNCLHADCRPFKMDVTHYAKENASLDGKLFLRFERDCFCTMCCINRPHMRVYYTEQGKDEYIGRIYSPCLCCSLGLDVENQTNDLLYKISGSCCQLGLWCKWPCEACQTIDFSIFDKQEQRVATLQKRTAGCVKSMVSDTANFSLKFPEQSDKIARALLLASVIFMDYRYFQERPADKRNQGLMGQQY